MRRAHRPHANDKEKERKRNYVGRAQLRHTHSHGQTHSYEQTCRTVMSVWQTDRAVGVSETDTTADTEVRSRARAQTGTCCLRDGGVERVKQVQVLGLIVLFGDRRRRLRLEPRGVALDICRVGLVRVVLNELHDVVGGPRVQQVQHDARPVVGERRVLREPAVEEVGVAAERLHDKQVVQLIVRLGIVHLHPGRAPVPAQRLVQVQHRDVGKVGHARNGLEHEEARKVRAALVQQVQPPLERPHERAHDRLARGVERGQRGAAPVGAPLRAPRHGAAERAPGARHRPGPRRAIRAEGAVQALRMPEVHLRPLAPQRAAPVLAELRVLGAEERQRARGMVAARGRPATGSGRKRARRAREQRAQERAPAQRKGPRHRSELFLKTSGRISQFVAIHILHELFVIKSVAL